MSDPIAPVSLTVSGNTITLVLPSYTVPSQTVTIDLEALAAALAPYLGEASSVG